MQYFPPIRSVQYRVRLRLRECRVPVFTLLSLTHASLHRHATSRRHRSAPAAGPPRDRRRTTSPTPTTVHKSARAVSPVDAPTPFSGGLGQRVRERRLGAYVWRT